MHALQKLLKVIWPSPTNDVSFIPYTVWEILSEPKKKAYRDMHQGFTENTRVITLSGIQNSLLTINTSVPNTFEPHPARTMINFWMSSRKASDLEQYERSNGVMAPQTAPR